MKDTPLTTLADVARLAGVSLATASRVLSASKDRVRPELAQRVLDAAAELHYVPNAHAQALARASSTTVGMVVHDVSDPYFAEIARGVLRAAGDLEQLVMICNSYRDPERELAYIASLRAQRVRAILMAGSGYVDAGTQARIGQELDAFRATGGRVALIGRHQGGFDAVLPDNAGGARMAARHLVELGHRHIAVVAGPPSLTTIEDRLRGFRDELATARVRLPKTRVTHVDFTRTGGYEAAQRLIDESVTAVFALNDMMAVGVMAALRERGIAVPEQISVIGFDDLPLAGDVSPALTTVRIPMERMGAEAVALTLPDPAPEPRAMPMPSELVVRGSTGPAPAPRRGAKDAGAKGPGRGAKRAGR